MIEQSIMDKANYCLNCINKPCSTKGCPMHTNIPGFITRIKENDLAGAYKILKENNIFSYICALICPQEEQCADETQAGRFGLCDDPLRHPRQQ